MSSIVTIFPEFFIESPFFLPAPGTFYPGGRENPISIIFEISSAINLMTEYEGRELPGRITGGERLRYPGILQLFEMTGPGPRSTKGLKDTGDIDIPQEIADSLCSCGGFEGLVEKIPPGEQIEKMRGLYQACADPVRLKILCLLNIQPLCVCVIKAVIKIADSKLSYHLTILKKAGLIEGAQQGNYIIYTITTSGKEFIGRELERLGQGSPPG
jgi:DNA-binding transcriptional ArsR family regulator